MLFNRLFLGIFIIGVFSTAGNAQSLQPTPSQGLPYFFTYTPQDYPGEQQNRWITQWKDKSMLVANSGGLLQHSDSDWRIFGADKIKFISALKKSHNDTSIIWTGSFSNIGYFAENDSAYFSYTSLTKKLDKRYRDFSSISTIEEFHGQVFFLSDLYLLSYHQSEDTVRIPKKIYQHINRKKHHITHIARWHKKLYVFTDGGKIITLDGSGESSVIAYSGVKPKSVITSDKVGDQLLLGDSKQGLFLFDGTSIKLFKTPITDYLRKNTIRDVLHLSNGDIAIATEYGGTTILYPDGRLKYLLSKKTGLKENVHNQLYEDNAGDLWIAGNESITKVFTGVPVRQLNGDVFGFNDALQITHFKDKFYVGSMDGLFRLDHPIKEIYKYPAKKIFTNISPKPAPFWDFSVVDGKLWAGGNAGVYEIDGNDIKQLFPLECFFIRKLSQDKILIATSNGVNLLRKKGNKWIDEGPLGVANFYVYALVVVNDHTFWAGGVQGQLVQVSYNEKNGTFTQKSYTAKDGVLSSDVYEPTLEHGKLIVNSNSGFMRYDKSTDTFKHFTGLNDKLGQWGEYLSVDESGNYWCNYITPNYRGIVKMEPQPNGQWIRINTAFEISRDHFGDFIEIEGRNLWVGSTQSIMHRDLYQPFNPPKPEVYIWNVQSNFDQKMLSLGAPTNDIPFGQRNVGIELASTSDRYPEKNQFRYKIDDSNWSEWRAESKINMNSVLPGNYRLTVQTRDFIKQVSDPVTYTFGIAAPWYLSNWAYALYIVFVGVGLFSLIRAISNYRVRREMDQLKLQEAEKMFELDAMKDRLFANISHEFRTPLTISHGLVKKVIQQFTNEDESTIEKQDLLLINRNMMRLKDMVDQIIDLTKSDQDYLTLTQNYYPAEKLTSLSVESFRSLAAHHGHHFKYIDESNDAILFADRPKVEIIINNIISNAIKFTPNGGKIVIKSTVEENKFILTVSDTGPGIPAGDEEAIFERFHRIEQADGEYVEGMGVGLELSRTLARLHGGDIKALPDQSQGATFVLTLPIAETDDNTLVLEVEDFEPNYALPEENEMKENRLAWIEGTSRKILLVEDNADMRSYVEGVLSNLGEVNTAADGEQAWSIIQDIRPDLIITDLMMPKMDGKTLVQKLAAHERWKEIPVVVLTAKALVEDKLDLLRMGVVDYITKPFEPEQLVLKSGNLLNYYKKRMKALEEDYPENEDEPLTQQLVLYIREHLSDTTITVDRLVSAFPQSRRSLYRNLRKETGMTPSELIREVRLSAARELVNKSSQTYRLEKLAATVGYKSATSFRKAYENLFGEHPLEG